MLTNEKLLWKLGSLGDDGRMFESKPLDQSDEPELLQEVKEARTALIEQVHDVALYSNVDSFKYFRSTLQVSSPFHIFVLNHRLLIWMMSLLNCC